jgi:uncharacterized protein
MQILKRKTGLILILMTTLILTAAEKGSFLWKVTGGTSNAYLLGSIHIVPDDIYPLDQAIEKAFETSDILAVEADMNSLDQTKLQMLTMQKGLYLDGNSLEKVLDEETYRALKTALDSISLISITQVKLMKPWLAAITVPQLLIMKYGYSLDNGIDMHFLKAAQKRKMTIKELESAEFQIELISGFSEDLQVKFLKSALKETGTFKNKFDEMVSAWKKGDAKKMDDIINKELKNDPELSPVYDKLIGERNITMTEKIDIWLKATEKNSYFIVVGAGHLTGKSGIVELLKKKGYKIEKL